MAKYLTAATWAVLVLGGAAIAEPPATDTTEVVSEGTIAQPASVVTTESYSVDSQIISETGTENPVSEGSVEENSEEIAEDVTTPVSSETAVNTEDSE